MDFTGFRLQFILHLMQGRNDEKGRFPTFYEAVNVRAWLREALSANPRRDGWGSAFS